MFFTLHLQTEDYVPMGTFKVAAKHSCHEQIMLSEKPIIQRSLVGISKGGDISEHAQHPSGEEKGVHVFFPSMAAKHGCS